MKVLTEDLAAHLRALLTALQPPRTDLVPLSKKIQSMRSLTSLSRARSRYSSGQVPAQKNSMVSLAETNLKIYLLLTRNLMTEAKKTDLRRSGLPVPEAEISPSLMTKDQPPLLSPTPLLDLTH